jgi:hypothetical protein
MKQLIAGITIVLAFHVGNIEAAQWMPLDQAEDRQLIRTDNSPMAQFVQVWVEGLGFGTLVLDPKLVYFTRLDTTLHIDDLFILHDGQTDINPTNVRTGDHFLWMSQSMLYIGSGGGTGAQANMKTKEVARSLSALCTQVANIEEALGTVGSEGAWRGWEQPGMDDYGCCTMAAPLMNRREALQSFLQAARGECGG